MANRNFYLFLLLWSSVFFYSNSIHSQTASVSEGCAPLGVSFTAPNGLSDYFWDFNDRGTTSGLQNPSHNFVAPGTYTVSLFEGNGGSLVGDVTITVLAKPTIDLAIDPSTGCAPLLVNFSDNTDYASGVQVQNYTWTFGDGTTGSSANPSHSYSTGTYNVGMRIETNYPSCDTAVLLSNAVNVGETLSVDFEITPSSFSCTAPLTVGFINNSAEGEGITYEWDFGNGQTSTEKNPSNVTYTSEGTFPVILRVNSEEAGCSNQLTKVVSIGSPSLATNIRDTMCFQGTSDPLGKSVASLVSGAIYDWDFGPNIQPRTSTDQSVNLFLLEEGFQDITFRITDADSLCSADTTFRIFVEKIDMSFTVDPSGFCDFPGEVTYTANERNAKNYSWTFDREDQQTGRVVQHLEEVEDTSYYHQIGPNHTEGLLFINTEAGCFADTSWVDSLIAPYAALIIDINNGCAPHDVAFDFFTQSLTDIVSYELHYGDGTSQTFDNDSRRRYTYNTPGEYEAFVVIENDRGCLDTSVSVLIEVGEPIDFDFEVSPSQVCVGQPVELVNVTEDDRIDGWRYDIGMEVKPRCNGDSTLVNFPDDTVGFQDITLIAEYNGCFTREVRRNAVEIIGSIAKFDYRIECDSTPIGAMIFNKSLNANLNDFTFNGEAVPGSTADSFFFTPPVDDNTGIMRLITRNDDVCPSSIYSDQLLLMKPLAEIRIRDEMGQIVDSPYILCPKTEYQFESDLSENASNYCGKGVFWEFNIGAGMSPSRGSVGRSVVRETPDSGLHVVTLEITANNGCTDVLQQDFRVYGLDASFEVDDKLVCSPSTVNFRSNASGDTSIVDYQFITEDGGFYPDSVASHSILNSPADTGFFVVEHLITDTLGCTASDTQRLDFYIPFSNVNINPSQDLCVGDEITVNATDYTQQGSFLNYDWELTGEGTTDSFTTQNLNLEFDQEGNYILTLLIEEDATGCNNFYSFNITAQNYPIAGFVSDQDSIEGICNPATLLLFDTTISNFDLNYEWIINGEVQSDLQNPGFSFDRGEYNVQLVARTPNGCVDSSAVRNYKIIGPVGEIQTDSTTICKGGSISFELIDTIDVAEIEWDFGDGVVVSNQNPVTHEYDIYPPDGTTTATVTMIGVDGKCTAFRDVPINIIDVLADFVRNDGVDTALCLGEFPFISSSTNADQLTWDFGDGGTATGDSVIHTYRDSGFYDVTLMASNDSIGCSDEITKEVLLYPLPVPVAIGDTICLGDTANISVDDPSDFSFYDWLPDSTIVEDFGDSLYVQPRMSRTYALEEEDSLGCVGQNEVPVFVIQPIQGQTWDTSIVVGDTAFLPVPSFEFIQYDWDPETGLSCFDCSDPYIQIFEDENYVLTVGDILNCFEADFLYNIEVIDEEKLRVPSVFTPNGDDANDIIFLEGWAIKELLSFRIFNRWGEKVFETTDKVIGWDGTHKGEDQNPGVYFYQVEAISWRDDNVMVQEGSFELVR